MITDLLPTMELPYVVVTSYPGASPEKVEQMVTRPLEALGTSSGLKNISSVSGETQYDCVEFTGYQYGQCD